MKEEAKAYFQTVKGMLEASVSSTSDKAYSLEEGIERAVTLINNCARQKGKIMVIGNGASAAIANHLATDFCKSAQIKALTFNDSSLLTCLSNDYGYEYVFEKPIETFAAPQDILVAISSSGKSENILRAVRIAKKLNLKIITLSGFDINNPLKGMGEVNFYVPSSDYSPVEIVHQAIAHCLVDMVLRSQNNLQKG